MLDTKIRDCLVLLFLSLCMPMFASAQSLIVYKDGKNFKVLKNKTDKQLLHTSSEAAGAIQFAIDNIGAEGGNIMLGRGAFPLKEPVYLKSNVTLSGQRRATSLRLYRPNNDVGLILKNVHNATVKNLTVTRGNNGNARAGISIEGSQHCQVKDIFFLGFPQYGLELTGKTALTDIDRCTFADNKLAHIYLDNIHQETPQPNTIINCTFLRGGYGVEAKNKENAYAPLKITDNIFFFNKGPAVDAQSNSLIITGNKSYWGESDGFRVKGKNFTITGNAASWHRGHGLVLDGAENGLVTGNNWTDNGARSRDGYSKCGVALYNTSKTTITSNSIWNFGDQGFMAYAIYEAKNCKNNIITANTGWFHKHKEAILSKGEGTRVANNNSRKGKYRGDYWDFTQKYGMSVDKYIKNLYLQGHPKAITHPDKNPLPIMGNKIIESKDMFRQVLSGEDDGNVKKFGWVNEKSQVWKIVSKGNYYKIVNMKNGQVLQSNITHSSSPYNSSVDLGTYKRKATQHWRIENAGNHYYKIINKASGKVLSAEGLNNYTWGKNDVVYQGENARVTPYEGKQYQLWRFLKPNRSAYLYKK